VRGLVVSAILLVLAGCGGVDPEQRALCERVLPALHLDAAGIEVTKAEQADDESVVIDYRLAGDATPHWLLCQFAGGGLGTGRLELDDLASDSFVSLSPVKFMLLKRFWLRQGGSAIAAAERLGGDSDDGSPTLAPYLLQQTLNAAVVGSLYGLLAIAYSLVYGVIGRLNLAFGDFATLGAYGSILGLALFGWLAVPPAALLLPALLFAVALAAGHGWLTDRLVLRPLRGKDGQAVLIATIGVALALQEYLRLTQGADGHWLQPILSQPHRLLDAPGFPVVITTMQGLVLWLTLGAALGLWWLLRTTTYGRHWRAVAQDGRMAALVGVDVDGVVARAVSLGAAAAAVSGFLMIAYYGVIGPSMGTVLGFKALVAAVVGGLGSPGLALLGGLLVGALETFWTAFFNGNYRDVAVFALLAAVLVLRPPR
jgi:branched-chain amino acid transport system permease protein